MISVSLARGVAPGEQRRFAVTAPVSALAFGREICTSVWSPIIWQGGVRSRAAFVSSQYMTLDFDGGVALADVRSELLDAGVAFLIGTTKSHQLEKKTLTGRVSPACDRFRVVIRAATACASRELYEYNLKELAAGFGADESCADGARFFYPCRDIVCAAVGTRGVAWRGFDADYVPEAERFLVRRERLARLGKSKMLEPWANDICAGRARVPEGDRHRACYRLGAHFAALGFTDELMEAHTLRLLSTAVAAIGEVDVRRAIRNGWAAENGQGR